MLQTIIGRQVAKYILYERNAVILLDGLKLCFVYCSLPATFLSFSLCLRQSLLLSRLETETEVHTRLKERFEADRK